MKNLYLYILLLWSLFANAQLTGDITVINGKCFNLGEITAIGKNGVMPYVYAIGSPNFGSNQSSGVFQNLNPGVYSIRITDAVGSIYNSPNIVVAEIPSLTVFASNASTSDSVVLTAAGGTPPYQYSVDNELKGPNNYFYNLSVGEHRFFVEDANGCIIVIPYTIRAVAVGLNLNGTNPSCAGDSNGMITATPTGGIFPYTFTIINSITGTTITTNTTGIFTGLPAGNYIVSVTDAEFFQNSAVYLAAEPLPLASTINIVNSDIIVNASGGTPPYLYSINSGPYQTSNVFTGLPVGSYSVQTLDRNNCFFNIDAVVNVAAPLINNQSTATINFPQDGITRTLANIIVPGSSNLKWYANPGTSVILKKSNKFKLETPLPLTTVLQNNTTYYASQTINGFESQQRLAVNVTIGAILSTNEIVFEGFKHYPNPIKNSYLVSNNSFEIQEINVLDLSGKTIISKKINAFKSEIDFSNLTHGMYFVKVKSEDFEKTFKVFKE
jgi:hypothetical protein